MTQTAQPRKVPVVWMLTDGKIGDEVQCRAIAQALAADYKEKRIQLSAPWSWAAPWGPINPAHSPSQQSSPIAAPFPDVVVASGRRAIPYAREIKKASGGDVQVVLMKDPRIAASWADMIWTPLHDRRDGENVFSTLTSPHGLAEKITNARVQGDGPIAELPQPLLGVVLGGASGAVRFGRKDLTELATKVAMAAKEFRSVAVTPSRRTPAEYYDIFADALHNARAYIWDRVGDNPYTNILGKAEALIVTGESHNMMSEALGAGVGVYVFRPDGLASKFRWFLGELERQGAARPFTGVASPFSHAPIDATAEIVSAVANALKSRKK